MTKIKVLITNLICIFFISHCTSNGSPTKKSYADLLNIFENLRDIQQPQYQNGVPDFSTDAMKQQYVFLRELKSDLHSLDTSGWNIGNRVDYHLVKGELAALEFHHNTLQPWSKDPGFYSFRSGDAGASMNIQRLMEPLYEFSVPLSQEQIKQFELLLNIVPNIFDHARGNLTDSSYDLAVLAIRNGKNEAEMFLNMAQDLKQDHPQLSTLAEIASNEILDFGVWLSKSMHSMKKFSGSGKEDYSWWMKNVQFSPWGWEASNEIIQREYDRVITFLEFEENRNKDLPALKVAMNRKEYETSLFHALNHVVEFLRDSDIMTIDDWVNPSDYSGFEDLEDLEKSLMDLPNHQLS